MAESLTTPDPEADRLRLAGRRYRATQAAWRELDRRDRAGRRAVTYVVSGVAYRLLPGQRLTLPLAGGGTLTLCGE